MKRLIPLILVIGLLLVPAFAADANTGLTPALLHQIEQSFQMTGQAKLAYEALAANDATKLTVNRDQVISVDPYFSKRLQGMSITNQKASGRCWMFAGLNILRPIAIRNLKAKDIEFSENYVFFYDKLEKANMFLEAIIKTREKPLSDRYIEFLMKAPVPDGGQWVGLVELIRKYGLVPKEIMPETFSSSHSATVNRTLGLKLKEYALRIRQATDPTPIEALRLAALKDVYRILAVNFGVPPKSFRWRYEDTDKNLTAYKEYTPLQFYKEVVNDDLDNYYALYSIPTRPYMKLYQIDLDKAVYDRPNMHFVNCPIEVLKDVARKSVLDNNPVWFGCDVGKESLRDKGLMIPDVYDFQSLYGMKFNLSRKDLFETYSDTPTHAMVFTGLDQQGDQVRKWLVENSWGKDFGNDGYFYMLDDWFDYYVQVVVVRKDYIPADVLKIFQTQAETLPPWDPMYKTVKMVQ